MTNDRMDQATPEPMGPYGRLGRAMAEAAMTEHRLRPIPRAGGTPRMNETLREARDMAMMDGPNTHRMDAPPNVTNWTVVRTTREVPSDDGRRMESRDEWWHVPTFVIDAALASEAAPASGEGLETNIDVLRAKAWRLCEAVADKAAASGFGWKAEMDADSEFMAALKGLRTACDGRPR